MIFWLRAAENADIVTTTPAFGTSMSRPAFGSSMSRFRPESVSAGTVALALTVVAHVADLLYHLFGFLVVVVVVIA